MLELNLKKQKGRDKFARFPIRVKVTTNQDVIRKPDWIRVRLNTTTEVSRIKQALRTNKLVTVCEEASCPNLPECFGHGTATFMIMGDKCTRRCRFCDVGHGKPDPLDPQEPIHMANTIADMQLKYVVITSVNRDDLADGGAGHFAKCIQIVRNKNPNIKIETLVPDFRGRMEQALQALATNLPDVFNHNTETAPRLYRLARPGSDYQWSLNLLKEFKQRFPDIPTKSGMMLGLGETIGEVEQVMADLRQHDVNMLTLGQYLQPSAYHLNVDRYVHPDEFARLGELAKAMGFTHVASGPLVRSSYHADKQAAGERVY